MTARNTPHCGAGDNQIRPTTQSKKKEEYICNFIRNVKDKGGKEKKVNIENFTPAQRRKWILDTFELRGKPCLQRKEDLEVATELLLKYWDLFSHDGSYDHTQLIQH